MAKSKGGKSSSKSKSSKKDKSRKKATEVNVEDTKPVKSVVIGEKTIVVTVETLDNIVLQSPDNGIIIQAQFGDILQIESPKLDLSSDSGTKVSWEVGVPVFPSTLEGRNYLATHPVLFTILEVESDSHGKVSKSEKSPSKGKGSKKGASPAKDKGSKKGSSPSKGKGSKKGGSSKGKKSKKGASSPEKEDKNKIYGRCNFDLIFLLLGEIEKREVLLIQSNVVSEIKNDEQEKSKKKGKDSGKGKKGKSSKSGSPSKEKKSSKNKSSKPPSPKKGKSSKSSKKSSKKSEVRQEVVSVEVPVIKKIPTVADLPRMTISVVLEEPLVSADDLDESNMIFITLESMYNPLPTITSDALQYNAATVVPCAYQKATEIRFSSGYGRTCNDKERTKRWIGLANLPGKDSYSKYKINTDMLSVKNSLHVDVCKAMNEDAPRIEWNLLQRFWLDHQGLEYVKDFILKYKWWPLEIYITSRQPQLNGKYGPDDNDTHLIAFFEMSKLLHPGVTRSRVVGQVYTFCQKDVEMKCGISKSMIVDLPPEEEPVVEDKGSGDTDAKIEKKGSGKGKGKGSAKSKKSTGKSESSSKGKSPTKSKSEPSSKDKKSVKGKGKGKGKGKSDAKKTKIKSVLAPLIKYIIQPEGPYGPECVQRPLSLDNGKPVFIVLEIELRKPIRKKRTLEELLQEVEKIIPKQPEVTEEVMKANKADKEYCECIAVLTENITNEYQKFLKKFKNDMPLNTEGDISQQFLLYLRENNIYQTLKDVVLNNVSTLVTEKLGYMTDNCGDCSKVKLTQKYISEIYVRLVKQMHTVINSLLEIKEKQNRKNEFDLKDTHMRIQAREAVEMGNESLAEKVLLQRIEQDNKNPEIYLENAIFNIKREDVDIAMTYVLEALSWDKKNKLGILLQAILLALKREHTQAETFFELLMALYPEFLQGGIIFYLFYLDVGNKVAAEVTMELIRKSTAIYQDPARNPCLIIKPLLWCPDAYQHDSMYLSTAVLLLKLNELYFAKLALNQEQIHKGSSPAYLYFLAVHHYLSGQYEEPVRHLEGLLGDDPRNCALWSLLGHCRYKTGDADKAMESYQFVYESTSVSENNHLVSLRLGEYYLEQADYQHAKNSFLEICSSSPTSNSWLGVGIACYMLDEFNDAEKALTEANILDSHSPIIWGYLALLSLHSQRQFEFEHCYCQAIQNNLRDEKLLDLIEDMRIDMKYPALCKLVYLKVKD